MFWSKKSKEKRAAAAKEKQGKKIRKQAMANANAARDNLGQDTIDKIAAKMTEMQKSNMAQAKASLEKVDTDKMLNELKNMLDDKD